MSEAQLKGYLSFDDADLAANRAGKLSAKQAKKINELEAWTNNFIRWVFVISLIVGLGFAYLAVTISPGWWVGAGILLVLAAWMLKGMFNKVDDSVQKAEGRVEFVKVERLSGSPTDAQHTRHTVSSYEMRVGGDTFSNANPALTEYMQGDVFAVYYTKATRKILSVEFISKGER